MKSRLTILSALVILTCLLGRALADEDKTVTLAGKLACGMCVLKDGSKDCNAVLQVQDGEKTVNYYLADNEVTKKFHDKICNATVAVSVTGTVTEKDSKHILAATKIEEKTDEKKAS